MLLGDSADEESGRRHPSCICTLGFRRPRRGARLSFHKKLFNLACPIRGIVTNREEGAVETVHRCPR